MNWPAIVGPVVVIGVATYNLVRLWFGKLPWN